VVYTCVQHRLLASVTVGFHFLDLLPELVEIAARWGLQW